MNTLPLTTLPQARILREKGFEWKPEQYWCPVEDDREYIQLSGDYVSANGMGTLHESYATGLFDRVYPCPSIDLALRWCRTVKGIYGWVENVFSGYKLYYRRPDNLYSSPTHNHTTYGDQAQSALLDEILKMV